jgi:2'-5' RNA ligase
VPRLFLGLDLPDVVDSDLQLTIGGIPGARWQSADQLHLTLHFLGDVEARTMRELITAFAELRVPSFDMRLQGVGVFPHRGPARALWFGVRDPDPIRLLHERCGKIIDRLGLERERRKFAPHVTIARLDRAPAQDVAAWITGHALYATESWHVDRVQLYSSMLGRHGPRYHVEANFPFVE